MNKKLLVANWKSYLRNILVVNETLSIINTAFHAVDGLVICPPSIYLSGARHYLRSTNIALGAQNIEVRGGSVTGDILASMVKDIGCKYTIIGHSEIRGLLNESDDMVSKKAETSIKHSLIPIICVGEHKKEREAGRHIAFIRQQIIHSLPRNYKSLEFIIAYEPVWAIGSGMIPTTEQISEVIQLVRSIPYLVNKKLLYGGSVNASNSKELARVNGLSGFLVGGASISPRELVKIWSHL